MATLRDLGLSEYETRVYRALLTTGPTTAKELSRASEVPMGRIYDVLDGLESAGLVRSQSAGRPKKYAPVEPETALDRLVAEKRREFEAELDRYEAAVEELADQLETAEPAGEGFWTVAIGPDEMVDLLVERLAAATDRIVMVAAEPSPQFDLGAVGDRVAGELREALDRGVDVSVLVSPGLVEAVPEPVMERYTEHIVPDPAFEARTTPDISGTFNLVDRTEVCIEVPNPLSPGEAFGLVSLADPAFAANVHEAFSSRWEEGDPLEL